MIMVTPSLPFSQVSSDATLLSVSANIPDSQNSNFNNFQLVYLTVGIDDDNRIFVQRPNYNKSDKIQYQWYCLDHTAINYPTGDIESINCSFSYIGLTCIIRIVCSNAAGNIFEFTASYSVPGIGVTTYIWRQITPTGDIPTLPNPI